MKAFFARAVWLCPVLSVVLAVVVFVAYGLTWSTALIGALVLACPTAIAWLFIQERLNRGDSARRMRSVR